MDFDEYEYLERTVENQETPRNHAEDENQRKKVVEFEEKRHNRRSKNRSDESHGDFDRLAKRSRSREEYRDGDDRSRRHGSSRRERERNERDWRRSGERRERYREDGDGKGKDKGSEGEKERERERRCSERQNDREREREQERPCRGRSHGERHRDDREREIGRDKARREREQDQESSPHKEKKEEAQEPEADPERDQQTVFAYQISLKADEKDVYEFFSKAGKVRDVRLIMDRKSRRSKGCGYVEFYDVMSVPMAIALSGQALLGQPVMVKPSEAEKNLVQPSASKASGAGGGPNSGVATRLYVGNLHINIKEDQLRQVFEPFGSIELVQLPLDPETGYGRGFGFVQFTNVEDARAAQNLDGQLEIAGRVIKVSAVTEQEGMQDVSASAGDFDDDESGGLSLDARARALLMQKYNIGTASSFAGGENTPVTNGNALGATTAVMPLLATVGQLPVPAIAGSLGAGLPVSAVSVPTFDTIGAPSECLLLKNMFDPKLETEADFDLDIKEDIEDECSKFGLLRHIYVDKNSAGLVYLRFENTQTAQSAQRALHGRWFAGKMVTAVFVVPQNYVSRFPDCR